MNLNELGEDLGINFNKVAAISDKIATRASPEAYIKSVSFQEKNARRDAAASRQTNLLLLIRGEELVLEEDEIEGSDGDTAVREIEDRFEEAERMASDEREPGRPGGIDQREVEHVHYLAEHHGRVGTAELGHLIGRRCGKQLTVEQAVNDIAESTGRYESQADQDTCRHMLINY